MDEPAFIAKHTLLRLTLGRNRSSLMADLSRPQLLALIRRILDRQASRADVRRWLVDTSGVEVSRTAFYRFALAVSKAACQVHADYLAGAFSPARRGRTGRG